MSRCLLPLAALVLAGNLHAAAAYTPIAPTLGDRTVTLTGQDLSIQQVVDVARHGARVELSPEARQRSADAYELLLEAAAENIPVYWFNRGVGSGREQVIFKGDPRTPQNRKFLEDSQLALFRRGAFSGMGPEVADEELVRAMLVVRVNTMSHEAASPQLTQRLLDLLNDRITPVVQSRSTIGEGDLGPFTNVAAAMVGAGNVYYQGVRMGAAQALAKVGLEPLKPFGADDSALESTNAFTTGQAAMLLAEARETLGWADLAYAIDLNAMNSSVSPLSYPVQRNRPFKWLNWDAARVLEMLRGSYLFELDDQRIIQDPESLRASSIRQGSAWQAWAQLRDDVAIQMNASDHNPAVRVGVSPEDSWELSQPQLKQFYVRGSARNHFQHGYIVSNANWDPYPMANDLEAMNLAFANMDAAVLQRLLRFSNPFFTVLDAGVRRFGEPGRFHLIDGSDIAAASLMAEIQGLITPVPPQGNSLIQSVEDLQSQTRLKVTRGRTLVADSLALLAEDLLTGTYWLDLRANRKAGLKFGESVDAVWRDFRTVLPPSGPREEGPTHELAENFVKTHPAARYYSNDALEPEVSSRAVP